MTWARRFCTPAMFLLAFLSTTPARAEFTTKAGWNDQLFPSFLIATATIKLPPEAIEEYEDQQVLGDPQGLLGVTIEAPEDDCEVTVTISCDAIMQSSTCTVTLPTAGEVYTILPKIKYDYEALGRRHQPCPIAVSFEVQIDEEESEEVTETMTLRSVNDCPFTIVDGDETTDVSFVFAAYVNEQHPFVDKVLREALNEGVVDSFTGYQTKDPTEVYRQVYALWHALSKRDLRYSSITTSAAENDAVASQHVRMIDESIGNAQANCVDGSVLMASLLRKVGIEPVLVMVPGHCYLAFYTDAERTQLAGFETTLLGSKIDDDATEIEGVTDTLGEDFADQNSWKTFTAALAMGTASLVENAEKFDKDDADYQLINIAAARRIGILPIAFQDQEAFVSAPTKSVIAEEEDEE